VVALPDGTQDRLSAMYQFMFLSLKSASTLDFAMTNGNKLDNYHYALTPDRRLKTPPGSSTRCIWTARRRRAKPHRDLVGHAAPQPAVPDDRHRLGRRSLTQVLNRLDIKP